MKARLRYVHRYADRHGRTRHYFKRSGYKSVALPGLPGSAAFMKAYNAALAMCVPDAEAARNYISAEDHEPGAKRSIYFVGCDGHVKIGISKEINQRIKEIAVGQHNRLELLAIIPNADYGLEADLHERFAAHRVRGEWFKITPEIQSLIDELNACLGDYRAVRLSLARSATAIDIAGGCQSPGAGHVTSGQQEAGR